MREVLAGGVGGCLDQACGSGLVGSHRLWIGTIVGMNEHDWVLDEICARLPASLYPPAITSKCVCVSEAMSRTHLGHVLHLAPPNSADTETPRLG